MTKNSGGATIDRGPEPRPDRGEVGEAAGNVREQGEDPSPGDGRGHQAGSAGAEDDGVVAFRRHGAARDRRATKGAAARVMAGL